MYDPQIFDKWAKNIQQEKMLISSIKGTEKLDNHVQKNYVKPLTQFTKINSK